MSIPTLEQTVRALVSIGAYKLAFRFIWQQYRVQRLLHAKAKYNLQQERLLKKSEKINEDVMMLKFKSEMDLL